MHAYKLHEVIAYARKMPYEEFQNNLFSGPKTEFYLQEWECHYNECALWYFDFSKKKTTQKFKYLGVLDIDFGENTINDPLAPNVTVFKEDTQVVVMTIKDILDHCEYNYDIYYSGNKGIHIYIYDTKFIYSYENKKTQADIKTFMRGILNSYISNIVDYSIYPDNKGIRPFLIRHPKTSIMPRLIFTSRPTLKNINNIWEYLTMILVDISVPCVVDDPIEEGSIDRPLRVPIANKREIIRVDLDNHNNSFLKYFGDVYFGEGKHISPSNNTYIYPQSNFCPIANKDHRCRKTYVKTKDHTNYADIHCYSGKCNDTVMEYRKKYKCLTHIVEEPYRVITNEQTYVSKEDIHDILDGEGSNGMGCVFAPMGSGKTQALKKYLEDKGNDLGKWKMLLIVVRVSQAYNFCETFSSETNHHLRLENYLSFPANEGRSLHHIDKLVITINSLDRILANGELCNATIKKRIKQYDILILDEIESIIVSMFSNFLNMGRTKQVLVIELLCILIKSSKRVIFMDGIPKKKHTMALLEYLNIVKYQRFLEVRLSPDHKRYYIYSGKFFEEMFLQSSLKKKRIVFVSNTKGYLRLFARMTKDHEGSQIVICGESSESDKLTIRNPNSSWSSYTRLFYNSAVGPGASYDIPPSIDGCFDEMYVFIAETKILPQDVYQMINRIRHINNNIVRIYMAPEKKTVTPTTIITPSHYKNMILKNALKHDMFQDRFHINIKSSFPFEMDKTKIVATDSENNIYSEIPDDIGGTDLKIMRTLASEDRLCLQYGNNFIMDMVAQATHDSVKYTKISVFKKSFIKMLRRNGAIVIDQDEKNTKVNTKYTRLLKKRVTENNVDEMVEKPLKVLKESSNQGVDGKIVYDTEIKEKLCRFVDFTRPDIQQNFMKLVVAITRNEGILAEYEKESFYYFTGNRKVFSHAIVYSTGLLDTLYDLIEKSLGLTFDKKTVFVSGVYTTQIVAEKQLQIFDQLKKINMFLKTSTPFSSALNNLVGNETRLYKVLLKEIDSLFFFYGMRAVKKDKSEPGKKIPSLKRVWVWVEPKGCNPVKIQIYNNEYKMDEMTNKCRQMFSYINPFYHTDSSGQDESTTSVYCYDFKDMINRFIETYIKI